MQKGVLFLVMFSVLFVLGVVAMHAPLVTAEDGSTDSNSGSGSVTVSADASVSVTSSENVPDSNDSDKTEVESEVEIESEEDDDADDDEIEIEDDDERRDKAKVRLELREEAQAKLKERIKTELGEDGKVEIEREIETDENGEVRIKIKRKYTDSEGNEITKVIVFERNADGSTKQKLTLESSEGNIEVETELEIEDDSNESGEAKALLSNGRKAAIKVMPDTASEVALERLRALNFSEIELKEVRHQNEVRAAYHVKVQKQGRFLGLFKTGLELESQVDAETGEVLATGKPWWAFLVSGEDSDQTNIDSE